MKYFRFILLASVCVTGVQAATTLDLTTANASATGTASLGGTFRVDQVPNQSTGTGVIDPFLRVQATGNNDSEQGYNTSNGTPFDDKGGVFTRALLLSEVPVVNLGGTNYRQFLLDVNQTGDNPRLSLNQIQIFMGSVDPACPTGKGTKNCGVSVDDSPATDYPVMAAISGTSEIFRMSCASTANCQNTILLDYSLNSGSGSGDMFLYVASSLFTGGTHVIFYSQFGLLGNTAGLYGTNDGFEEWSVLKAPGSPCIGCEVPEPNSALLLGTAVMALGLLLRRRLSAKA